MYFEFCSSLEKLRDQFVKIVFNVHIIQQQARKAAEKAHEVVKVEERVNRAVMVANRAANSARVAATKAVQTKTYYSSGGDDPL